MKPGCAFMFPGQGSQTRGMGVELFARQRHLVAEADELLGYSIEALCLDDQHDVLSQTNYTQPALFTVEALSYLCQKEDGKPDPDYFIGHSLGEFAALFAAGVFDFSTGLAIVQKRGELMAAAPKGGMAAIIGLSKDAVIDILHNPALSALDLANENAPQQCVIAGPIDDIQKAGAIFEGADARYIPLNVGAAFHSRYMRPVQEEFACFLDRFSFQTPLVPVISNVTARPHTDIKAQLVKQISSPVQWVKSITFLLDQGVTEFTEVGPGRVLHGLVEKIRRDFKEALIYSRVCAPDRFWSSGEARCRSGRGSTGPVAQRRQGPKPAGPFGLGRMIPDCSVTPLDRRMTAAPRSAPFLEENGDASAGVRIDQSSLKGTETPAPQISPIGRISTEPSFEETYGVQSALIGGSLGWGVTSSELVISLGKSGFLGTFGAQHLSRDNALADIGKIKTALGTKSFAVGFVPDWSNPEADLGLIDSLLKADANTLELSGMLAPTLAITRFRLTGARLFGDGRVEAPNRIIAKVSRPATAELFWAPPPPVQVSELLSRGLISEEEAAAAARLPLAQDICALGESAGLSERANVMSLLPYLLLARERMHDAGELVMPIRIGAAGGFGSPIGIAAAFMCGADFVMSTSPLQCTVEAGTSDLVKEILTSVGIDDFAYAPCGHFFEQGGQAQVLRKGVFFPARARKLYSLWQHHESLQKIDAKTRDQLERNYFSNGLDQILQSLEKGHKDTVHQDEKTKMGLVFRQYFSQSLQSALCGTLDQKVNFQVQSGAAIGALNHWINSVPWDQRSAADIFTQLNEHSKKALKNRIGILGSH